MYYYQIQFGFNFLGTISRVQSPRFLKSKRLMCDFAIFVNPGHFSWFATHKHGYIDRYVIQRFWRISLICQYLKNKARMLESSLYKSSRLIAGVTLAPFLESPVQNFWNFFFASVACGRVWHGLMRKWIGLKKIFQKCSRSPILTPGVSNRSSFQSRLTNPKSWRPQGPSKGPNLENFQGFHTTYSVTYSKG